MKYAVGNSKLGKKCLIVSRPVGLTCPSDCFFLNNGCYAQATEKRFPNARKAGWDNVKVSSDEIYELLLLADKKQYSVRIHERGDFILNDKVDWDYVKAWKTAVNKFVKEFGEDKLPHIWVYTHAYYKGISNLSKTGINVYASVHNKLDYEKAKKAGFDLFAFCSTIRKKKGGSRGVDKYIEVEELGRTLVCPEQRLGRNRVTCDKCKFCISGKGNILFLEH